MESSGNHIRIVPTGDRSHTLYVTELNEHYHSIHGAINESLHVFINSALSYFQGDFVKIFEVGLGTGLNAFLTMLRIDEEQRNVRYHAIEKYPLSMDTIRKLNYTELLEGANIEWFEQIHQATWQQDIQLTPFFSIKKIRADLLEFTPEETYNVIYFDAFAPEKQPELWTTKIFRKLYNCLAPGGILTTYSSKGEVKRTMKKCGFLVDKIAGPPGKREMLRCIKS